MQLNNRTPFSVKNMVSLNEEGMDTLYVIVKASFDIEKHWTLANEQSLPQAADEYWGDPSESSLKYATDFHPGKAATDIIVSGHACAPDCKPVHELDVRVTVGDRQKIVRVFGDRYWHKGLTSPPETFETLPLLYEKAFGGQHILEGKLKSQELRNPVGKGYQGERSDAEMEGQPLPNIEDPQQLIRAMSDTPTPAGFGFQAPHWQPRVGFGGTYDEHWQQSRAPYLPVDYDKRFQNAAHPDLIYPGFLSGGESVEITHMHPAGTLHFLLPKVKLVGRVKAAQQHSLHFNMESVIIEPSILQCHMVWKAAHVCYNDAFHIQAIDVDLSQLARK